MGITCSVGELAHVCWEAFYAGLRMCLLVEATIDFHQEDITYSAVLLIGWYKIGAALFNLSNRRNEVKLTTVFPILPSLGFIHYKE